jgi:RimJ/RimL family protein N-acetyltransferase
MSMFPRIMPNEVGPKLIVRPIRPDDRELLVEAFARLSDESRYLRFFTPKNQLTPSDLSYLTECDGISHFALGAAIRRKNGTLHPLGVARYVRAHDEPTTAHVALTIVDEAQRHGLATHLLRSLAHAAVLRGIEQFCFTVLPANVAMRSFLATHGVPMVVEDGLIIARWPAIRAARIHATEKWRALLTRAG